MQNDRFQIPVCRIYANQLIVYTQFDTPLPRSVKQKENQKNLTRGCYNGYMSPKTKSKVKKYLSTWLHGIKEIKNSKKRATLDKVPYLTFVTLTLPSSQMHGDNTIKRKCLIPFIETLRRKHDVWNYFWRAEAQENNNIHFHILIDSYIPWKILRDEWNECINKLDYVDRFEKAHNHQNPNSTDIHGIKLIRNIEAYVMKYVTKADGYRPIKGRIHGCSDDLKRLQPYEELISNNINELITDLINQPDTKIINDDCYTIIFFKAHKILPILSPDLWKKMQAHYLDSVVDLYTIKLPDIIYHEPAPDPDREYYQSRMFEYYYEGC